MTDISLNQILQVTDNNYNDYSPQIWGNNIVWSGYDGNDEEIYLYNGSNIIQLTDNDYSDFIPPQIWGNNIWGNKVVWSGYDGNDEEIYLYEITPALQLGGGGGRDQLIGVDLSNAGTDLGFGAGEVDSLTGGGGRDTFVLGDENRVYYDDGDSLTRGESDLALISDFDSNRDFIQLHGSADSYSLDFFTSELEGFVVEIGK